MKLRQQQKDKGSRTKDFKHGAKTKEPISEIYNINTNRKEEERETSLHQETKTSSAFCSTLFSLTLLISSSSLRNPGADESHTIHFPIPSSLTSEHPGIFRRMFLVFPVTCRHHLFLHFLILNFFFLFLFFFS